MTSTEDSFIFHEPSINLSGSTTFDEDDVLLAQLDFGACSSSPLPAQSTASLIVPCPLSIESLPELDEDSLAVSTAAAIAASNPSTAAPSSLSIQLPKVSWPEPKRQQEHYLPVVTPRSPDATRISSRAKKPSKKAAAVNNTTDSALTAALVSSAALIPPFVLKVEADSQTAPTVKATMSQQPPRPMVAPSAVQSSSVPPAPQSSNSNQPPSHQHLIHQQQPPPSKPSGTSLQENTGRWTAEEHRLFLQGLEQHGKGWKKIASLIKSRTVVQIRTHAQKYFQKLAKARQNGEQVGGVMDGAGAGVAVSGGNQHHHHHVPMTTRDEAGGPPTSAYPHVSMRTVSHHDRGNMSIGTDPTSLAAAAGHVGIADSGALGGARKRRAGSNPGGSTKRRAIGSVVRSSVREGRTAKRQNKAAQKRKHKQQHLQMEEHGLELGGVDNVEDVPNPLPSISQVLDPYMPLPPPPGTLTANVSKTTGRNQLVNTATHNTLPMAALEDAV